MNRELYTQAKSQLVPAEPSIFSRLSAPVYLELGTKGGRKMRKGKRKRRKERTVIERERGRKW